MSKKILVVEDHLDTLDMMTFFLKRQGYVVITANDGQEGFDRALSEAPDLIVTDIQMPNLDGIEMIKLIRREPQLASIPVIVLTAYREGRTMQAINAGADEVTHKPVRFDTLLDITNTLLSRHN